jgi:parallel beta-helix repeat protein
MSIVHAVQSGGIRESRLVGLVGAVLLAGGGLLALLLAFQSPAVAEMHQTVGYVDGGRGTDGDGCGIFTGTLACKTIQYAIDAQEGYHVIRVAAGVYSESVRIGRDLTLEGGWNSSFSARNPTSYETTIAGESGTGMHAVAVSTATVAALSGLTVFRGDDGVHLYANSGARLTDLAVHGTDDEGIESNGAWLVVSNVQVFETGDNGVFVDTGSAEIYSASVHDTGGRGIYLRGRGSDTISATVVYQTLDDGIRIRDARSGHLIHNRVYAAGADGIQVDDVTSVLVEGNTVYATGGDGLKVDGAGWAALRGNTVHDVENQGVQIQKGNVVTVEDNVVSRTGGAGVLAENAGGQVLVRANSVYSTTGLAEDGIHVSPGVVATIRDNTIRAVTDDAIDFKGLRGVVEENEISVVGDVGIWISETTFISVAHNTLHDVTDSGIRAENSESVFILYNTISHTVAITGSGIAVGAGVAVTIEHNRVYDIAGDGIELQNGQGWIRQNEVYQIGQRGIILDAGDVQVLDNLVYDTWGEGLRVSNGGTAVIEGNTIHDVMGEHRDGIHVEPDVVATIAANRIFYAADDGITFNGSVGTIDGNDVRDNGASGIDVDADEVTIAANRIFNNGTAGIELERAASFTVSNNLVGENGAGGVLVMDDSMGRLVNNTLVGHPSSSMGVGVYVLSPKVTLTSANNIIISHTVGIAVVSGSAVTTAFDDVWHNGLNYNGIASGSGSLKVDPRLADVHNRDYHLLPGSPCVDAGWAALAPALDFERDPRIGNVDIGADELVWHTYLPLVLK